jgi:dihydrofolate synthase/folylpolyglutamate synthase
VTLVFAAMRDKAIQEMADILFPVAEHVVVVHIDNPRAASTEELLQAGSRTGASMVAEESVAAALARAAELTAANGVVVVTGSIFLVGDAMKALGIPA